MWVGLICGWSLACGLGLIMDWDFISEHFCCFRCFRCFHHFCHSAVSPCPLGAWACSISNDIHEGLAQDLMEFMTEPQGDCWLG